jgi:argininosuccinate lyase
MKLWEKGQKLNKEIEKFTVGNDYVLDLNLVYYDCQASISHVKMLEKIRIIKHSEAGKLVKGLKEIIFLNKKNKFKILPQQEDCHTAIEEFLTKKIGNVGKKIHTGRSRNDQVLVATRLYMLDQLKNISQGIVSLEKVFLDLAKKYEFLPLPGYTHTRRAMPSSVGHWGASFLEELIDDHELLAAAFRLCNKNPLGAAAGFGISFPLDRKLTAKLLGFNSVQMNSLYCVSSRGKIESVALSVLTKIMMTLARLSNDMILYTSEEFNFFKLPDEFTTGSSIMPHKKNPDVFEIMRGNAHLVAGFRNQIENICFNLISGYNRDTQLTKEPLMKSMELAEKNLKVCCLVMKNIKPNLKTLLNSFGPEFFTVSEINKLVKKGVPFREAYADVKQNLGKIKTGDPVRMLKNMISPGAPGNLKLNEFKINKRLKLRV